MPPRNSLGVRPSAVLLPRVKPGVRGAATVRHAECNHVPYIENPGSTEILARAMNASDIIFYTTPQGEVRIEVFFEDETFWLSQKKIAELFDKDVRTVNEHLNRIFKEGELSREAVIRNFRITESVDSSPSAKMFWICSLMVRTSFWNNSDSSFCVSQTVSFSSRTSMRVRPSAV